MRTPGATPLAALYRDLAAGLQQQMFFWGKDAEHPKGNLFVRTGFEKRPSGGLTGTSCYRLTWGDGTIELHGSHAGWLGKEGGMIYIRPFQRCVRWLDIDPPVPGKYSRDHYSTGSNMELHRVSRPFFDWWLAHERKVNEMTPTGYRDSCHRLFKKLPRGRAWLRPEAAIRWVARLRDSPGDLPRAKRFTEYS